MIKKLKEMLKQIRPNLKSMFGGMLEKRKALTHQYPSKVEEFKKWGFDPKQYHHIIRLYDLLFYNRRYNESLSYLKYDNEDAIDMIKFKRNSDDLSLSYVVEDSDDYIECAKKLIPEDYEYEIINLEDDISKYIEDKIKLELSNHAIGYAREIRTFDAQIPKGDLKKFPELEQYQGQDISYIVYESLEIL